MKRKEPIHILPITGDTYLPELGEGVAWRNISQALPPKALSAFGEDD